MDLDSFFREHEVVVFSEVSIHDLSEKDLSSVLEFLPAARSVIVFGKEVPVHVYQMTAGEMTHEMFRIAESVEQAALNLTRLFFAQQIVAKPVPLLLPVRIVEGRIEGLVRLKQVAAVGGLGSIGKSTLLLSPRFGPRLVLGGVVTSRPARQPGMAGRIDPSVCTGCERCIRACPTKALGPGGVDAFRCRDVNTWIPGYLVPIAKWMLRRTLLLRILAPLVSRIARYATMPCSLCVTECPQCETN